MDSAIIALLGALIGAASALVAQWISNRHQRQLSEDDWRRRLGLKRYEQMRSLYAGTLANFERCIRATEQLDDYSEVTKNLPRWNARLRLLASKQIVTQSQIASEALYHWSVEYRSGSPRRVGKSGFAVISSTDIPHSEKARSLYPAVNNEIAKLAELMEADLKGIAPPF
jgi:hypothetical protein